jgi:hypothetical protein
MNRRARGLAPLLTLLLTACGPSAVGGWRDLGTAIACADQWTEEAVAQLDSVEPSHPPAVAFECYKPQPPGEAMNLNVLVYVFTLEDGSRRAVGVYCSLQTCGGVRSEDFYSV